MYVRFLKCFLIIRMKRLDSLKKIGNKVKDSMAYWNCCVFFLFLLIKFKSFHLGRLSNYNVQLLSVMIFRFDFSVPVLLSSPSISLINSYQHHTCICQFTVKKFVTDCMTEHNIHINMKKLPLYTLARLSAAMFYVFHTILQRLC